MKRNIEIKALNPNRKNTYKICKELCGPEYEPKVIRQQDTFFNCSAEGRLKIRNIYSSDPSTAPLYGVVEPECSQLIYYERPSETGPKMSSYSIVQLDTDRDLKKMYDILSCTNGISSCVNKERTLFIIDQTRIHLDSVQGLGEYLELEVVLEEGQDEKYGERVARSLMEILQIKNEYLIEGAYADMLRARDNLALVGAT